MPDKRMMRIQKVGVVGAGTMGAGIAALAASAGVPVVLLDIPASEGDPGGTAKKGLERQLTARPPAFMKCVPAVMVPPNSPAANAHAGPSPAPMTPAASNAPPGMRINV